MSWNCGCCQRELPDRAIEHIAVDADTMEEISVGSDCIKKIKQAGTEGYSHKDGPLCLSLEAAKQIEREEA